MVYYDKKNEGKKRTKIANVDMRKFINIRPMSIAAVSLAAVTVAFYLSLKIGGAVIVITYFIIAALLIFWLVKHYSSFNLFLCVLLFVLLAVLGTRCFIIIRNYHAYKLCLMTEVDLVGTVKNIAFNRSNGKYFVTLENVSINGVNYDFCVSGALSHEYVVGQTLSLRCNLNSVNSDSIKYSVANNIVLNFANSSHITVVDENIGVFTEFSLAIKSIIKENIPGDYDFAVALMLGETDYVNPVLLENFRYSGIAHIFAVSGLHVGFLCSVVGMICEGFYIKYFKKCVVVTAVAFIYAGICGFSESALRAVIICFWVLFCKSFGKMYDPINAISFAFITLLLVNPFSIMSVGFVLSFACVISISLFKFTFLDILNKTKLPLKNTLAVSLSILFGVTPIMCYFFGYVSVCSLILNIVFVPIASALYTMLVISVLIAGLKVTVPLKIVGVIISLFKELFGVAEFSKFIAVVNISPLLLILYYSLAFFAADIVNIKKKHKVLIIATLFASLIVLAL